VRQLNRHHHLDARNRCTDRCRRDHTQGAAKINEFHKPPLDGIDRHHRREIRSRQGGLWASSGNRLGSIVQKPRPDISAIQKAQRPISTRSQSELPLSIRVLPLQFSG
jgi:hypothetical protein